MGQLDTKNTAKPPLPGTLPLFPLNGVLLLPAGHLPLNIFEPRYIAMLDDALKSDRMIGIIQPKPESETSVYDIGCAGRIIQFTETPDGRYEILLKGISRFRIEEELSATTLYRQAKLNWTLYAQDLDECKTCLGIEREGFKAILIDYLAKQNMACDIEAVDNAPDKAMIACLAMACPLEPLEKQALLEETCCEAQAKMFIAMMEMALYK